LAAVISEVPRADFDESALREHLADMAWVESVARAHQGVLDQLCSRTTVIPMRMCTVYHSDRGVQEMLRREATTLLNTLEYLDGRREWGVQAFFSRSRAAESTRAPADGPSTGTAYLEQRREQRELDDRLDELVEESVQEIHGLLAELAVDSTLNAPQRREASGRSEDMVLNGVYLVEKENEDTFSEQVRGLGSTYAERGLELDLTGPWPPYNFLPGSIGATW
jgi:gas vesicle protein GvpL/GvpF